MVERNTESADNLKIQQRVRCWDKFTLGHGWGSMFKFLSGQEDLRTLPTRTLGLARKNTFRHPVSSMPLNYRYMLQDKRTWGLLMKTGENVSRVSLSLSPLSESAG